MRSPDPSRRHDSQSQRRQRGTQSQGGEPRSVGFWSAFSPLGPLLGTTHVGFGSKEDHSSLELQIQSTKSWKKLIKQKRHAKKGPKRYRPGKGTNSKKAPLRHQRAPDTSLAPAKLQVLPCLRAADPGPRRQAQSALPRLAPWNRARVSTKGSRSS